jgi:superfamily I DNA/RNA helicase
VLVRRVQYLIDAEQVQPAAITALTFTRAAAAEMADRLAAQMGAAAKAVRVSTLHSFALRQLVASGAAALPFPLRVVGDWEERHVVVEELAHMLGRRVRQVVDDLARLADDWDNLAADGDGWETGYPDPEFIGAWRRHREVYGYTLRSELVYQLLCEIRSNPDYMTDYRCDVLLVDEYQDLNSCDLQTVRHISDRARCEVMAVGDDDQSIYSFRHAHPEGIRRFDVEYGTTGPLTLEECLRCGPAVVELANWLIAQEADRVPKSLVSITDWNAEVSLLRFADQEQEAAEVARIIEAHIREGIEPEEVLVLLKSDRNGKVSELLDAQLAARGVVAYFPRKASDIAPGLQIVFEYMVLAQTLVEHGVVDHMALRSLLELGENGVGAARIARVVDYCLANQRQFADAINDFEQDPSLYSGTGLPRLLEARAGIVFNARELAQTPGETVHEWYERVFALLQIDTATRETLELLLELLLAEGGDVGPDRSYMAALGAAMTSVGDVVAPREVGKVTITTMHGAKGLSADLVVVLQVEDEVIPGDVAERDVDEARRLLYVSLTRARRHLVLTACARRTGPQRFVGQREVVRRSLTRFIRDYGFTALTGAEYMRRLE